MSSEVVYISVAFLPYLLERRLKHKGRFQESLYGLGKLSEFLILAFLSKLIAEESKVLLPAGMNYLTKISIQFFMLSTMIIIWAGIITPVRTDIKDLVSFEKFRNSFQDTKVLFLFLGWLIFGVIVDLYTPTGEFYLGPDGLALQQTLANELYQRLTFFILSSFVVISVEELVYRYFAIKSLTMGLGKWGAIIFSSLLWTLGHGGFFPDIFIVGLFLGRLFIRNQSLTQCIMLHFFYNIFVYSKRLILPLL